MAATGSRCSIVARMRMKSFIALSQLEFPPDKSWHEGVRHPALYGSPTRLRYKSRLYTCGPYGSDVLSHLSAAEAMRAVKSKVVPNRSGYRTQTGAIHGGFSLL